MTQGIKKLDQINFKKQTKNYIKNANISDTMEQGYNQSVGFPALGGPHLTSKNIYVFIYVTTKFVK